MTSGVFPASRTGDGPEGESLRWKSVTSYLVSNDTQELVMMMMIMMMVIDVGLFAGKED